MTAKEFLSQAVDADARIAAHMAQISHLRAIRARGERVFEAKWQDDRYDGQIAAMESALEAEMKQWAEIRRRVADAIAAVPKENHRLLLEYRYLCGWDLKRTAMKMHYSLDRLWHLHGDALREFVVPEAGQQAMTDRAG